MTAPTDQQILEEAIQKAIDGGWKPIHIGQFCGFGHDEITGEPFIRWEYKDLPVFGYSVMGTIFNHDFAKALWGDTDGYVSTQNLVLPTEDAQYATNGWKYLLQQMVIADDPIQYLGENL